MALGLGFSEYQILGGEAVLIRGIFDEVCELGALQF